VIVHTLGTEGLVQFEGERFRKWHLHEAMPTGAFLDVPAPAPQFGFAAPAAPVGNCWAQPS
jgi:hypothetical protein